MIKKGDTLIEVTLAVGIFSMIAIAIVAVMSNGVANAQTALESTLTREEIDTQAEALRFIHSSYIANTNNVSNAYYADLWEEIITNYSIDLSIDSADEQLTLQYTPATCEELYNQGNPNYDKAFVINTRLIGDVDAANEVIVGKDSGMFAPAVTYPRLVYGNNTNNNNDEPALLKQNDSLFRAEGIFIIAVKDNKTTTIGNNDNSSAFYDFYIRTCWYGNKSSDASTISTVMRLYDPAVVSGKGN